MIKLASKLSCFVEKMVDKNKGIRIIVCYSDFDPGKANANLKILKQFGIVPLDIYSPQWELDLNIFTELSTFKGLSIIIQSISVPDFFNANVPAQNGQNDPVYQNLKKKRITSNWKLAITRRYPR